MSSQFGVNNLMRKVADTGKAGVALVNGTPTILSWTAPNDGQMHRVNLVVMQFTAATLTGGASTCTETLPDGVHSNSPGVIAAAQTTGQISQFQTDRLIAPGSVFSLQQSSAATGGSATMWAQIWAN